ncbi:hypothetical protein STACA0001_0039 [Staphylococcus capitis SK14]|nr:hypothetical protein STACA0001_0039 [Staphylococcus capitis SK14]
MIHCPIYFCYIIQWIILAFNIKKFVHFIHHAHFISFLATMLTQFTNPKAIKKILF